MCHYVSCCVVVILDANGFSKGYGFVRFADEDEQKDALLQMNGFKVCYVYLSNLIFSHGGIFPGNLDFIM